ncbi:MAG: class I SAM-dependent methyltransferase [Spirochaetaceae bacterium]|jgi:23S rRNA G2069 N7-methylase RlmK/C1962 C5-methylase RlmI|nr:class I SAM-dependent methyltransferase [Spirochaetaceae bacterium]
MDYQAEFLLNRLTKRFKHLSKWARRTNVCAFRLYDRDIPEFPLVLDYYDGFVVGALYAKTDAGATGTVAVGADNYPPLHTYVQTVSQALNVLPEKIYIKTRQKFSHGSAGEQYEKQADEKKTIIIEENGLKFRVNLSDYLDTGLFLEKRLLRKRLFDEVTGMRVLNLFSYTGAFSVYALAGGAIKVDSVDISNTYNAWAAENMQLNQYTPNADNRIIRADVLKFLAEAKRKYEIIILDPPAFSNSKKMEGTLDLKRDAAMLIDHCLGLLTPGGKVYFCSQVKTTTDYADGTRIKDITRQVTDEDFRGKRMQAVYEINYE